MSPSFSAARPFWVWSLPAFAVLLSLLWYRKKRGSLKTDSGGAGETRNDKKSVDSDEESPVSDKSDLKSGFSEKVEDIKKEEQEEVEEIINAVKIIDKVESKKPSAVLENFKPLIDSLNSCVANGEVNSDLPNSEKETEEQDNIIRGVEESVLPIKDEETIEEIKETVANHKEEEIPVFKSGKFGKKKKMKNSGKKLHDSKPDAVKQGKEENTACILEKKLAKLELEKQQCNNGGGNKKTGAVNNNNNGKGKANNMKANNNNNNNNNNNKSDNDNASEEKERNNSSNNSDDVTERDSANNSPSEVMLASPSVSGYSDTHSEGSSDSGKGCSEMLTPSRTPASGNSVSGDLPVTSIYEFVIPQHLVGRLIGRYGSYVNEIKETTHASIYIKRHPDTSKLKICAVEGTQMDIESALDMIRQKFPKKRYPNVTLEQVVIAPEPQMIPIISESMQLYLIEGINNDVLLSSLVSAGHFFLQQPTHPTYLSLNRLNTCMNYCYSEPDQPLIPDGVGAGILCAAPVHNGWYRAQIVSMDEDSKICDVKFVDYGGYMTMPVSLLRQIRFDFVNLPFQAAECYLASVKPSNEENVWCENSKSLVEKLTFGKVLQAQVYGYAEDGVPLIYLYTVVDDKVILVNEELVNHGLAEWIYPEEDNNNVVECVEREEMEETAPVALAV